MATTASDPPATLPPAAKTSAAADLPQTTDTAKMHAQGTSSSSAGGSTQGGATPDGDNSANAMGALPTVDETQAGIPPRVTSERKPVACLILGMAGAGKSSLLARLNAYLHEKKEKYYMINLDPAVLETSFGANIDIRDTVNYKEVMKQYALGPNGAILTSLNLFATRFDEVTKLLDQRKANLNYVLLDTPGQIEIFTWSASGAIISESLAATLPTIIIYVVDTPRSARAVTFMSNMLYACSILYKLAEGIVCRHGIWLSSPTPMDLPKRVYTNFFKTKLPLLLVFNKIDVQPHQFAIDWMSDLTAFQAALQEEKSYMGTLATSMALMLEEFYNSLTAVGVSALSGEGMEEFFQAVDRAAAEFEVTYAEELRQRAKQRDEQEAQRQAAAAQKFKSDRLAAAGASVVLDGNAPQAKGPKRRENRAGDERDDDDEEDDEDEDEDEDEDDEYAGYTVKDEMYNRDERDEATEREDYESLSRYLKAQREQRGRSGGQGNSS